MPFPSPRPRRPRSVFPPPPASGGRETTPVDLTRPRARSTTVATSLPSCHMDPRPRVVIIGSGFAGLYCARALKGAPVEVTIVDRRNHHLFQPLLYQVATAGLNPSDIAVPTRSFLRRQKNLDVVLAEVQGFDLDGRRVLLAGGEALPYDQLLLATGATHSY